MEGTVTQIENKNGKIRVAVDGKWYGTSKCKPDPGELVKGLRIQFEGNSWEYQGKTFWGINKWRAIGEAPAQNGAGRTQGASTIMDGDILRSVSNVVGNMAAAGQITHPGQIKLYVDAAYAAFTNMGKAQTPSGSGVSQGSAPKDPEFDDSDRLGPDELQIYNQRARDDMPSW